MTVTGERAARENSRKHSILKETVREYSGEKVMIMGDMNAHLGMLEEQMNQSDEMLADFIDEMNLENLNETLAEGRVTWNARDQTSAIDYVLVNGRMRENVARMWIDEDGEIDMVSDHNMLVVECMRNVSKRETERKVRKKKWRLRDAKWEEFQVCVSEHAWDIRDLEDVDVMNERLTKSVRNAGISKIGYAGMSGRKRMNNPWWNEDIRTGRMERKRLNKRCRWLKKKRNESEEAEEEYRNAWVEYVKQQRLTKKKIKEAKGKCERNTIQSLREKCL